MSPIEGVMEPQQTGIGINGREGLVDVEGLELLVGKLPLETELDGILPPPLPSLASAPASRMKAARPSRAAPELSGAKRFLSILSRRSAAFAPSARSGPEAALSSQRRAAASLFGP